MTLFIRGSRGGKPRETEGRQVVKRAKPEERAAFWVVLGILSGMRGDKGVTDSGLCLHKVCRQAKRHQIACVRVVAVMLYEF